MISTIADLTDQDDTVSFWKQICDKFTPQHCYIQKFSFEAKSDFEANVPWLQRRISFCADYCQTMDQSHFGSEQPVETYYYSPLNISCFGCTAFATDVLGTFIYNEGEGWKGGNHVCSLIFQKLKDDKSQKYGPAKQLSLVFDNCAGQNTNRMVLIFGQYHIDLKVFQRVEIKFLIMCHTKNICDRRFKDLKNNFLL